MRQKECVCKGERGREDVCGRDGRGGGGIERGNDGNWNFGENM